MGADDGISRDPARSFGELVKSFRTARRLTEPELAARIGYGNRARGKGSTNAGAQRISAIENGKGTLPPEKYRHLCDALRLSPADRKRLHWAYVEGKEDIASASALRQQLIEAIKPPKGDWEQWKKVPERTTYMLGLLVGAAAGFIQAATLLEHSEFPPEDTWRPEYLYEGPQGEPGFKQAAWYPDGVRWAYTPDVALWSVGFFINKAERNLLTVLETTTEKWLEEMWEKKPMPLESFPTVRERLAEIERCVKPPAIKARIATLRGGFEEIDRINVPGAVTTIRKALAYLEAQVRHTQEAAEFPKNSSWEDLDRMAERIGDSEDVGAACVALVVTRAPLMEHGERNIGRRGFMFAAECVVGSKATKMIADFWRDMLVDRGLATPAVEG